MRRAFATARQGFRLNNDSRELYIYDEIGPSIWGMVDSKSVMSALDEAGPGDITVRINSPGGDVFEGNSIYNALKRREGSVHVKVDALAASAASLIAMAGDTIEIAKNAMFMVHNAWTVAIGNADELREVADVLDKISGGLRDTYVDRTGQSVDKISEMLDSETWLTAEESVELGFADAIVGESGVNAVVMEGRFKSLPDCFREVDKSGQIETTPQVAASLDRIRLTRRRLGV